MQTIAGKLLRHERGVQWRRTRLDTPDGDFLDLDFADVDGATWADLGERAPVVLLLHGLEGSGKAGYMIEASRQLAARGMRPVCLNFRSCSGELNRMPRFYHAGETQDVTFVQNWLIEQYPDVAHGLIGFSLGANMLIKYLGEHGGSRSNLPQLMGAVAVSPVFDMTLSVEIFEHGSGAFYAQRFLEELKVKLRQKVDLLSPLVDVERALAAKTIAVFDDAITAPLAGYDGSDDYYRRASSINFIADVNTPLLLLRSLDDPFFGDDIPTALIERHPHLYAGFTEQGGHVGFVEGMGKGYWGERQAARFLAAAVRN